MALVTVYDSDGKASTIESVDAREYVSSGEYFYNDPTLKEAVVEEDDPVVELTDEELEIQRLIAEDAKLNGEAEQAVANATAAQTVKLADARKKK